MKHFTPTYYYNDLGFKVKVTEDKIFSYFYQQPILRLIQNSGHKIVSKLCQGPALEIGCGKGELFKFKRDLVGLDINEEFLAEAKEKYPHNQFIPGDVYKLPFEANSQKNIIAIYLLEHLKDLSPALREIKRVLRNNGKFYFSIPTEGGWLWNTGRRFTSQRHFTKMGVDYKRLIKEEHCNTADKILFFLYYHFNIEELIYWPFKIPSINLNLTITGVARK